MKNIAAGLKRDWISLSIIEKYKAIQAAYSGKEIL
jgi:hypothetical protein